MKNIKKLEALTDEDFERETPTSIYITTFIGKIFCIHYFSEDRYHNAFYRNAVHGAHLRFHIDQL